MYGGITLWKVREKWAEANGLYGVYRLVWGTRVIIIWLLGRMSWVLLWRRARRGIRWFRLVGGSLRIRLRG